MTSITPVSGWLLDVLARLDAFVPGVVGHYLRASDERRQVIAAFLAVCEFEADEASVVGELLTEADHRTILHMGFGSVPPQGLRGALKRAGGAPHEPEFYHRLYAAVADTRRGGAARLIQSLPALDLDRLKIADMLPPDLRHPRIIAQLDHAGSARDLITAVDLIEERGVGRAGFVSALLAPGSKRIRQVISRWVLRLPFPANPLPVSDAYTPISTGRELRRAALQYRNCSRRYLGACIEGAVAFSEYSFKGSSVLIHLAKTDGMWAFEGAHGYRNRAVDDDITNAAEAYARRAGVAARTITGRRSKQTMALRRLGALEGGGWF